MHLCLICTPKPHVKYGNYLKIDLFFFYNFSFMLCDISLQLCSFSVLAPLLSLLFLPNAVSTKQPVFHSYTNALSKVQKVNGRCFAIQGASLTKDLVPNNETASLLLVSCVFQEEPGQRLHPSAGYKVTFRQFISGLEKTQSDVNVHLSPFQTLTPMHTAKHRPLCACTKIKTLK